MDSAKAASAAGSRGLVEDNIIEDQARLVLGQTIQEAGLKRTVPDVVERLV